MSLAFYLGLYDRLILDTLFVHNTQNKYQIPIISIKISIGLVATAEPVAKIKPIRRYSIIRYI